MTRFTLAAAFAVVFANSCFGQHSDIEFGFDDLLEPTTIEVESDLLNSDGVQILEGEFDALGGDIFTDNPGFITAAEEGLVVNEGDQVFVRFLDASAGDATSVGAGFVNFYDPANPSAGIQALGSIAISSETSPVTLLNGGSVTGSESVFLSEGSNGELFSNPPAGEAPERLPIGEIHNHLLFDLQSEGSTPAGAVGILLQFEADLAGTGPEIDVVSEPFFLIFNNGLDDEVFEEEALAAFGVVEGLAGDFDADGDVDVDDIDFFVGNIDTAATEETEQLDLDVDGQITAADLVILVTTLVQTSNGQTGTFLGDLDLDGTVSVLGDAFILVGSLGSSVTSYGLGDINLDGVVTILGDAIALVGNLGNTNEP